MGGPAKRNGWTAVKKLKSKKLSEFLSPLLGQNVLPRAVMAKGRAAPLSSAHIHHLDISLLVLFRLVFREDLTDHMHSKEQGFLSVASTHKTMASKTVAAKNPPIYHAVLQRVP
ncbi:hypothetical protein TGPRC2_237060 [Toxoplasma gondii TgCatPRC2]|uniref:Uncharacterized protein n=15 Tax=Toxoplasma gondii TaxID=5811 RepID=B9PVW3_TOXGV|nr:hypothetical protein TGME49_237060 [Toxoplasma gondii ME49]EPR60100.1 hypothetical protein TGGT1_237060 [Toxoplasma gondii GT1]ESS31051.1 hypothetical protein TGVEG_237060 [Toxoplasma gondii VEG]KAF4640163.1 hypothetical protein TGRH88_040880 [Toxoplasma gondii]KFG31786.1 hypothetical protein TGDOM2_237060 [Toxoplasma gondii GAB2-2007-GAL-DOM2]KFG36649.1 hypothetical protein TGP89_237060 [Toxoplasma gondii p89]KFG44146.1 hypothetical protein TGFOU_237060 [Toxoplasma gondii FOU]KFG62369.1 |eukprot:XP_002369058.1 hypothetical protein TGME49_237060 [Toxoplasma gondii ME49]